MLKLTTPILNVKNSNGEFIEIPALKGESGVKVSKTAPTDSDTNVWIDTSMNANDDFATTQYVDSAVAPKANKSEIPDISGKADKIQLGDQLICSLSGTTLTITRKV